MTVRKLLLIESAWHTGDGVDDLTIELDPDSDSLFLLRAGPSGGSPPGPDHKIVIDLADLPAIIELVEDRPMRRSQRPQAPADVSAMVETPPDQPTPSRSNGAGNPPGATPRQSTGATRQPRRVLSPAEETAILARLRELAVDGVMPTRVEWDSQRGDLPANPTLVKNRRWNQWAQLAGLTARTRGQRKNSHPAKARVANQETGVGTNPGNSGPGGLGAGTPWVPGPDKTSGRPLGPDETVFHRALARKRATEERDALVALARQSAITIAVDGQMPRQREFDLHRQSGTPLGGELLHRLDLKSWGELAALLDLEYTP